MNKTFIKITTAVLIPLWVSACAHNPPAVSTASKPAMRFRMPGPSASAIPPEVRAVCRRSAEETFASHIEEAIRFAHACLDSNKLPDHARVQVLQLLSRLEYAHHNVRGALDAQATAVKLSHPPTDLQLLMLERLYRLNGRLPDALATLDLLGTRRESTHDLAQTIGMGYYDDRGWTLLGMGRPQEAIDAFTAGIRLQPARANAYLGRAKAREAVGDRAGARADYVQFARWAPEPTAARPTDPAIAHKLTSLGIDPARERLRPFGADNPLRDLEARELTKAQAALKSATTPQEKAAAYHDVSMYFDGIGQSPNALVAIDKALALAHGSSTYAQSKVVTLVSLDRVRDALAIAEPLREQAHKEAATSANPAEVFSRYEEVLQASAYAYLLRRDWSNAIGALADSAKGMSPIDQDYMAAMYLYVRAKSAGSAPTNEYLDDYIGRASKPIVGNYRRSLLLYWQGRASIQDVYAQIVVLNDPASIENALSETWFSAAAYERYVKHDEAESRAYVARINALRPYGTNEWMIVRRDAL